MSPGEVRDLFARIAADLRKLAEEKLRSGDPEAALHLLEQSDRAQRQGQGVERGGAGDE